MTYFVFQLRRAISIATLWLLGMVALLCVLFLVALPH
jgi:hypothetical protein